MAGHSKWSKVKRIEGPLDVKRGAAFNKLVKEITVAARLGGGDLSGNPRLRSAVDTDQAANMPKENIERAIKKGTGELEGGNYEEVFYEAHALDGAAPVIEAATDNKNRTAADLRLILSKHHGSFAASGSVSYPFHKKGRIALPRSLTDEDRILEPMLDADAEGLPTGGAHHVVTTPPDRLYAVAEALHRGDSTFDSQKLTDLPDNTVPVVDGDAMRRHKHHEAPGDGDNTQNAYSNFDLPGETLAWLAV